MLLTQMYIYLIENKVKQQQQQHVIGCVCPCEREKKIITRDLNIFIDVKIDFI